MPIDSSALPRRQMALPSLVQIGTRSVSAVGWRYHLAYVHLLEKHDRAVSWCDPSCMARVMFHHATPGNQEKVRQRFGRIFNYVLARHHRLIAREREHAQHRRITRFRLYGGSEIGPEAEALEIQLREMNRRKELTTDRFALALEVMAVYRLTRPPAPDGAAGA